MSNNNEFLKTLLLGSDKGEELPCTRRKQFFNVIKYNYGTLILLSILTFLFLIPLLVCHYCLSFVISNITDGKTIFYYTFIFSFLMIFCFLIVGLGSAGLSQYFKKLLWNEVVSIRDYFLGIKKNLKRFLGIFLIYGISYFFFNIDLAFYTHFSNIDSFISNLILFIGIIQFLLVNIMMIYQINIEVRYDIKFRTLIYNSFRLTMVSLIKNLLMCLLIISPWILLMFMPGVVQVLILSIYLFVGFALFGLAGGCYTLSVFDKFINTSEQYCNIYKKGLKK